MTELNPQLHGRTPPNGPSETRVFEQPWHRAAAYHFASGMSSREVAAANGKTPQCISQLLKNTWFQEMITTIIEESGRNPVDVLLKSEGINSLVKLIEIRDSDAPAAVRANVAQDIMDRAYGKAVVKVEQKSSVSYDDPVKEAERLEAESARLQKRLQT